ncbi:MAG TPA: aminopeptidase, partial [bacterium]|nr:aminopeptidase [bacterium]
PFTHISLNDQQDLFFAYCNETHLTYLPEINLYEAKNADASINILCSVNTKSLSAVDPSKQALFRKTRKPISEITLKKNRWVLALYPTEGYAQDAEMSLSNFEKFVVNAVKINKPDPVKEWKKVWDYQEKVINKLEGSDKVHIVGNKTDLSFSIKGRKFINSSGYFNMPSGEVYTGPVENSVNGKICFEFPACMSGIEVAGISLEFKNGKVINADAEKNKDFLIKMLDMDKGARYLGEFAFGLNYSIQKFIKNILFDEKIGGTIHLAVGNGYPETGAKNKSALHWDMIKDLRKEGEVKIDGRTVFKKGKFIF